MRWVALSLLVASFGLSLADPHLVHPLDYHQSNFDGRDWNRSLRVVGFIGTWAVIGLALVLIDSGRRAKDAAAPGFAPRLTWTRGPFVFASAALSGGLAELLKLLLGRGRPDARLAADPSLPLTDPQTYAYVWHGWASRLDNFSELGAPSSHAAVAFGGMLALCVLFPRGWPVFVALAAGCGLTRVLARAHYASDVTLGAAVGAAVIALIVWLTGRSRASDTGPTIPR